MILIITEIQYSGTALLLLVNHAYRIDTITPHTPIMNLLSVVHEWKPSRAYHKIDTFYGEQR